MNEDLLVAIISYTFLSWLLAGLWALFSSDNYTGLPYRLTEKAPTRDARTAIYVLFVVFGPLFVLGAVLYQFYSIARFFMVFVRGVRDLLPKRKTKLPEARIHHG